MIKTGIIGSFHPAVKKTGEEKKEKKRKKNAKHV